MHLIFSNAAGKNCVLPEKIVFEIIFRPEFNRHFVPTAQVRMSFFRQLFEYCCYVIDGILKNKKKKKTVVILYNTFCNKNSDKRYYRIDFFENAMILLNNDRLTAQSLFVFVFDFILYLYFTRTKAFSRVHLF